MYDEGDCPKECGGKLYIHKDGDCSCHINPPCSACQNSLLACNNCDWRDEKVPVSTGSYRLLESYSRNRTVTIGEGKQLIDFTYDSSSGSTMHYTGRYSGPVTAKDIVTYLGTGSWGHRGPHLYGDSTRGHFTYTKITD